MFQRKLFPALKAHLSKKQVTVLTGLRRTGKTTLVKALLAEVTGDNKLYIDLQVLANQDLFNNRDFEAIVADLARRGLDFNRLVYLALDEIQLVKELPGVVKYIYDNYKVKFILTGSSSYYIKNLFNESLAGRKKIFELYPLDFGEFLVFKGQQVPAKPLAEAGFEDGEYQRLKKYYDEYVAFGGFPEVVLAENNQDRLDMLNDIISSYVNIDIAALDDFDNRQNVYNLVKLLASRVGSKVDYSKLGSLSGLGRQKVKEYLELFASTYLISLVSVHGTNKDKEIVKAKKLYLADPGLLAVLAEVGSGAKYENALYCQLARLGQVKYYALKNGREIDFVLDGRWALEAKETPTASDLNDLATLSAGAGLKEFHLVGKNKSPRFDDYFWGGTIR